MLHENENDADGILKILKYLHAYVPSYGNENGKVCGDQGLVGDQFSVERGINGHMSLSNGFSPDERLDGLHFEIADWHAGNKFLEVLIKNLQFHCVTAFCIFVVAGCNNVDKILFYDNYY